MEHDRLVDLRGLCCGNLIRKLMAEIGAMNTGDIFLAEGDKESLRTDIPSYCRQTRHELLQHQEQGGLLRFWIKKTH